MLEQGEEMISLMIQTDRLLIREYDKKYAAGLYDILKNPPVHCFMDEKLNSLEEAERVILEKGRQGERFAVCLAETDDLIGELFADKERFLPPPNNSSNNNNSNNSSNKDITPKTHRKQHAWLSVQESSIETPVVRR